MKIATITPPKTRGEGLLGFRNLDGLRDQRNIAFDAYKGRHYMRRRSSTLADLRTERQPVNLDQQQIRTLTPFIAMTAPLADVQPLRADLEFEAKVRKTVLDRDSERMKLDMVYQDAATDAILSGLTFTLNGIKAGGEIHTSKNRKTDIGQEYTRLLNIDDITLDPMANTMDDCRFIGHRYTVSKEDAIDAIQQGVYGAVPEDYEDGQLPNPHIATPEEAAYILENMGAIESWGRQTDRVDDSDLEHAGGGERLDETIVLWDFVLFVHGEVWIATLPGQPGQADPFQPSVTADGSEKFLALYRWRGPATGPINVCTFLRVPFNKIPVSLSQMQRDLADICDLLANKMVRQSLRTKMLTIYDGTAEDMAMAMRKSPEGGYIRGNPKSVSQVKDGGLIPEMLPASQFFSDHWQNATGNLAMAAGSGDIGKTATAFEGLMGRIQSFLDFLRTRLEALATDDMRVRAWFLTNNPVLKRTVPFTIGQAPTAQTVDITIANPGAPDAEQADYVMQGDHEDFDIKTRAFSMQYTNPAIAAQQLMEVMQTTIPAITELSAAGAINGRVAIGILARKLNEPALENLIPDPIIAQLQQQQTAMVPQLDADPSGQGLNNPNQAPGPAGRKIPGGRAGPQNPAGGMPAMRPQAPRPMAA